MPDKITSTANPKIRHLVELRRKARTRREEGLFLIEGTRLCMDTPDRFIEQVYATENWLRGASEKELRKAQDHALTIVTEEVMAKAADTTTPQGILCAVKMPSWTRKDLYGKDPCGQHAPEAPLLLLLEDLRDPGNLGTIFRTAEAAGATGILMNRGTVDLFHPKVVRATMSAIFRMPFLVSDDLRADIGILRGDGIRTYAAHLGGTRPYDALPLAEGAAFLIGNEANGLSDALTAAADEKIIIPMAGGAESLNAAMAAGILLFEASRQRRAQPRSAR
ncbi:MAG: RNA methyltransferase [Eubacteriales bacterium]|nr:RNA methyltransferase [Eubacteriales bacterium]